MEENKKLTIWEKLMLTVMLPIMYPLTKWEDGEDKTPPSQFKIFKDIWTNKL